jgi:hypothetical protein
LPHSAVRLANSPSPTNPSPIENSSIRHTAVTKVCDCPFAERRGKDHELRWLECSCACR